MTDLLKFEQKLWDSGNKFIAGVDEAGRGPLAGPMVVASVVLNRDHFVANAPRDDSGKSSKVTASEARQSLYSLINDSKKVTPLRREKLYDFITENAIDYSIYEISHNQIDEIGIAASTQVGFLGVIKPLKKLDHVLTDHFIVQTYPKSKQTNIIRGDSASISIAAASILAKVYRDRLMVDYHKQFPNYSFDKHKGYGTLHHRKMIMEYGPCEIHRRSFKLVA